jgi:hypothetical protein
MTIGLVPMEQLHVRAIGRAETVCRTRTSSPFARVSNQSKGQFYDFPIITNACMPAAPYFKLLILIRGGALKADNSSSIF